MSNTPNSFPVNLKDNWLHPLSEFPVIDGRQMMDGWCFASMICGTATQRIDSYIGTKKGLDMLLDLGVIDKRRSKVLLRKAQTDDSEYLALIVATKESLDKRVDKAFNPKG
ncbi:hypothetical protein LC607_26410 [Nostoc sp. CHAB 5824]|nr:hypothetical protein [Nostoc sp. CHAB 5824]